MFYMPRAIDLVSRASRIFCTRGGKQKNLREISIFPLSSARAKYTAGTRDYHIDHVENLPILYCRRMARFLSTIEHLAYHNSGL